MSPRRLLLLNAAFVVWLLAVQIAYYRVHKPIDSGFAAGLRATGELLARPWDAGALLQPLGDLAAVGGLLIVAGLLGRALLRLLASSDSTGSSSLVRKRRWVPGSAGILPARAPERAGCPRSQATHTPPDDFIPSMDDGHRTSSGEAALAAVGLGLGGLSLLTLVLLALGWFTPTGALLSGSILALVVLGVEGRAAWEWVGRRPSPPPAGDPSPNPGRGVGMGAPSSQERFNPGLGPLASSLLATYVVLTLVLALLRGLAPPIGWDSLVYHLTGPRLWLATGQMVGGIDLPHYYFPPLMELLYALALLLRGDTAAQALHAVLAALAVAATGLIARRHLGPGYGLPAAALLLSGTSLVTLAGRAYVEWGLMLLVVLALGALVRWSSTGKRRDLGLAAVFLGLALGVKYTAVAVAIGAACYVVARELFARRSPRDILGRVALVGLVLGFMAAPWYLRSWVLTGNPLYPFVFGGWNWDAWRADWFGRAGSGLIQEPRRIVLAPWELTVLGVEGGLTYDGTIGPMFLILLPLAALLPRPPLVQVSLAVAGAAYFLWLVGATSSTLLQQPRLLYPAFPAWSIVGAWALLGTRAWALPAFRPRRLAVACFLLSLGLALLSLLTQFATDTPLAYLVGAESRTEYLTRQLGPYYPLVSRLDQRVGPEARVLFLWEPRTYYCPLQCQPDALLFNWRYALHRFGQAEDIHRAWVAAGYTHVLLHGAGLRYFYDLGNGEVDASHVAALREMEARYLERLEGPDVAEAVAGESERYTLYRIRRE